MSDTVIRKACDRCHHQKLSCKRTNEETCERCRKIQVNCTWSPSLRYKKSQQQQQQQKQQQQTHHHHQSKSAHTQQQHRRASGVDSSNPQPVPDEERRSPKRRRTGSDKSLVSPEEPVPIVPQPGTAAETTASKPAVPEETPGSAGLDIRDFDFNLGQLEFYDGAEQQQQQQQHHDQTHQQISQGSIGQFHHHHHHHHLPHQQQTHPQFFGKWDHALPQPHNGFVDLSIASLPGTGPHSQPHHHHQPGIPAQVLAQRTIPLPVTTSSGGGGSKSASRRRGRRLISLRASHDTHQEAALPTDAISDLHTPLHWMARLSEINARLQALTSLLPAQYEPGEGGEVTNQSFPVDEMFQLTRNIADVLDQLCNATKDDHNSTSTAGQVQIDGSDPGSAMFVLSIYVMLLDLYHKVFTLVRSEVFQRASAATFALWKLPDVTIGSFAVESTPSLQMSLTIQLAEEFLSRLRRSTSTIDPSRRSPDQPGKRAGTGGSQSIFSGVVDAAFQEIRSSEDSLRQELVALRDRIEEMLET